VSKETRTISDLVNAISEEMTRLDYKPTVLKQYHIVWNKLCKRAGVRPANDFDMEFGMKFLDEAMRAHPKHLNENSEHRWIKAIYTLADFKRTGILSLRREKRGFVFPKWPNPRSSNPSVLGKVVQLNGLPFTIIGITPRDFVGTSVAAPDFWFPLSLVPLIHTDGKWLRDRENQWCRLFARLAPGISFGQAQAEMTIVANQVRLLHDPHSELSKPVTALLSPGSPFPRKLDSGAKLAILFLMVAVGMVLVIACANVASLQLARAASRQSELCLRLSLGASRRRIIRQLLTESALLGLIAGVIALLFTWALLKVSVTVAAQSLPPEYGSLVLHVTPDLTIFAYVFAISLVAAFSWGSLRRSKAPAPRSRLLSMPAMHRRPCAAADCATSLSPRRLRSLWCSSLLEAC